ncbi:hypothetical protein TTHERM_00989500 (macronuclear) [Tetrahymena thermophila SB210]|uniref:Uncharacterized protein n=1 Tax=Tetrahymena thermophila (strain SB210) TaxID=312017 RepID=Q240J9_TETTS|nr:hypothetical protein TTHERM_00989500 [Tetrahymena thermophila SB210]EAS02209.1 hypothetical protein TTHERM_00989500 [Tetrahymena thermophila SB210]|eukprot:XP_001022454.1 hypothetical protein TTHERM_00989500 [Tetrahymena thermophila SB210]
MSLSGTPLRIKPHIKEILKCYTDVDTSKQSTTETRFTSTDQLYLTDLEYVKCAEEHFDKVYDYINQAREQMREYRREISDLKDEILLMKHDIQMQSNQNSINFKPACERLWKVLHIYSPQNEVDTIYLKNQVRILIREKEQLQKEIQASNQKLEKMEKSIGIYRLCSDRSTQQ